MSATLTPHDATRLVKLLGLLGSDQAGERDAAGLAAHRMLRDRGLTWGDVIMPGPAAARSQGWEHAWREMVNICLSRPGSLRIWEGDFLRSLRAFPRISPKQRSILVEIYERVCARAAA